jgi:hypothetical protein
VYIVQREQHSLKHLLDVSLSAVHGIPINAMEYFNIWLSEDVSDDVVLGVCLCTHS